ncbi:MAG: M15 family metallopeptidase [Phycisphaeraceae bacterium]
MSTLGQPDFVPVRPIAEVMAEALRATPPAEEGPLNTPDLVELRSLFPSLHYGSRCATDHDFTTFGYFPITKAFAQRTLAKALAKAIKTLTAQNFGVIVHDAYRPWHLTYVFWHVTAEEHHNFVANPARGSMHNRGLAVDLSLYDLKTNQPLAMPSEVDELSERAFTNYNEPDPEKRHRRDALQNAMTDAGFESLIDEWWHFAYRTKPLYPIMNTPIEAIKVS